MSHRPCYRNRLFAALVFVLLTMAGAASAQHADWISLDSAGEGTPAELIFDPAASNPGQSVLELKIHGFWMEEKQGDDGRLYQKITVPGMGSIGEPGAPALPALRTRLGVVTSAQRAVFQGMEAMNVDSFFDVLVWPQPLEELEPVEGGMPERFVIDWQIYDSQSDYPSASADMDTEMGTVAALVRTAGLSLRPFRWNPVSERLDVISHGRWFIGHEGDLLPQRELTRDRYLLAKAIVPNWDILDGIIPVNWWHYDADYLIITPEDYRPTLQDFIDLKKAQGYWVQVRYVEDIGTGCEDFRTAIDDWYALAPESRDKYCLLVGDVDVIPTCTSPFLNADDYPFGVATDDAYGSVNGYDLDEEVYVGRLSVDDDDDLAQQLDRIVAYQSGALALMSNWKQVALVAHKEDAPGKYVGAHESVRTASYSNPPSFETFYGHIVGVTDSDVSDAIDDGLGLLAYRGHGSSSAFTGWNGAYDYYDDADVSGLSNSMHPVVWSFACSNSRLSSSDCIAEKWMEKGDHGAISFYGSTVASYTSQNHELDRQMFQAVYDEGLTIQGQAIEYGEETYASIHGSSSNAWMYLLLGDPSMRIKTHGGITFAVDMPEMIPPGPIELDLHFFDAETNMPIRDAVFGVWKPMPGRSDEDEVFDNRYTAADGRVTLTVDPQSEGMLYWTLRGPNGEAMRDSIPVSDTTSVPDWESDDVRFWAEPSVTAGASTLRFGRGLTGDARVNIYDVGGRNVRGFDLPMGSRELQWNGEDARGQRVPGGVYFARVTGGGADRVTRVTVLR